MARWLSASFSWRKLVILSLSCLLILQLYSFFTRIIDGVEKTKFILALHPLPLRELAQVEELILLPPIGLRNPKKINLKDEFLDPSSHMRNIFFPNTCPIDPRVRPVDNTSHYYYPGTKWLDTDGNPIHTHILFDEISETYCWYGEYKDGPTYRAEKTGTARVRCRCFGIRSGGFQLGKMERRTMFRN